MKKREKAKPKPPPGWMVTMGDMNNLLMCLFIALMGDTTEVPKVDFYLTVTSFKGSLGVLSGGKSFSPGKLSELGQSMQNLPAAKKGRAVGKSMKEAQDMFKAEIANKAVRVTEDERGLVITLFSDNYFDSGSAILKPEIRPVLKKAATLINGVKNFVRIEGHTDNLATALPKGEGYRSNWDLSGARSLNVLQYFTEDADVNPIKLSAVAYGQYRPIDDNGTPEGRAYNRRVEIVILKDRYVEKSKDPRISKPLPDEEWR